MNPVRFRCLSIYLLISMFLITSVFAEDGENHGETSHHAHWGYEAPEHWGELNPKDAVCNTGQSQSPVNLTLSVPTDLQNIQFRYNQAKLNIVNNGHTIQANVREANTIVYNGVTYKLRQLHFHHPSEHTVNGVPAPMEAHFVHEDPLTGNLAVIGVLLIEGNADHDGYASILNNMPSHKDETFKDGSVIDLDPLLPENRLFATYSGSLTTPPCSEIVRWLVLSTPISLSAQQIEAFSTIYPLNARPVQPLHGRDLLQDNQ